MGPLCGVYSPLVKRAQGQLYEKTPQFQILQEADIREF